jgi:hypothetical protein
VNSKRAGTRIKVQQQYTTITDMSERRIDVCDCLKELEERLKDKFREEYTNAGIKNSYFENSALMQRGKKDNKAFMNYELTSCYQIKYTVKSAKGKELNKKKDYYVCFKYCPFCGEKLEKE